MRLTIKLKLALAFGAIIALSLLLGAVAYTRLDAMNATLGALVNVNAKRTLIDRQATTQVRVSAIMQVIQRTGYLESILQSSMSPAMPEGMSRTRVAMAAAWGSRGAGQPQGRYRTKAFPRHRRGQKYALPGCPAPRSVPKKQGSVGFGLSEQSLMKRA